MVNIKILGFVIHYAKWALTKRIDNKKLDGNIHKNAVSCTEQVLEATTQKTTSVRPPTTHHENYQS